MKIKSWPLAVFVSLFVHFLGFFVVRIKTLEALQEVKYVQVGLYESSWSDRSVDLPGEAEMGDDVFEAASQSLLHHDNPLKSSVSANAVKLPSISNASEVKVQDLPDSKKENLISGSRSGGGALSKENRKLEAEKKENRTVRIEGPAANRFVLYHQEPEYPEWAQQYGLEFQIRLKFWIHPNGEVLFVEVEGSSGYPEVDAEVIQVMKRWRFNAVDGPIMQWGKIRFNFRLS
jgi:TonB family protein